MRAEEFIKEGGWQQQPEFYQKQAAYQQSASPKKFMFQGFIVSFTPTKLEIYKGGDIVYSKDGDYSNPTQIHRNTAKGIISRTLVPNSNIKEDEEPIRIKISGDKGPNPAKEFVKAMYDEYPRNPINPNEFAVVFDDEHFAMFELDVNPGKKDVVYVKFMYSYPQRQGVGTRALKQLQDEAQQHGVDLELIAWDKGNVSKSALTRFYKKMGFQKDRGDMLRWKRTNN